jgi:hypothetical protein
MILTSGQAEMRHEGVRIGKVQGMQLQAARDAVETTPLNVWDRTFISGLRNSQATAKLIYDPEDPATVALLQAFWADSTARAGIELIFDTETDRGIEADAVITSLGLGVQFGEAALCPINLQISGKPISTL